MKKYILITVIVLFCSNMLIAQDIFSCRPEVKDFATEIYITDVEFTVRYSVKYTVDMPGGSVDREAVEYGTLNEYGEDPLYFELEIPEPGYQGYSYNVTEVKATISGQYDLEYSISSLTDIEMYINPIFYVHYTDHVPAPPPLTVAGDYDGDGINDAEELQIAEQFRPILIKATNVTNNEKQIELADFEETINNDCILKRDNAHTGQTYDYYNTTNLHKKYGNLWSSYGFISLFQTTQYFYRADFTLPDAHVGASYHNVSRPLYYHVYKEGSYYYVQYWYWFNMNDISDQTNNGTWHEGDWEHFTIRLTKSGGNYIPNRVNLYQHHGGHTKYATQGKWSSSYTNINSINNGWSSSHNHPIVFIASNSHASYFHGDNIYDIVVAPAELWTADNFWDQVNYNLALPDIEFFEYDRLVKLGEAKYAFYPVIGSTKWFRYSIIKPNSKRWLGFTGDCGAHWKNFFASTPSPRTPFFGGLDHEYTNFTVNFNGFGNESSAFKTITWPPSEFEY